MTVKIYDTSSYTMTGYMVTNNTGQLTVYDVKTTKL